MCCTIKGQSHRQAMRMLGKPACQSCWKIWLVNKSLLFLEIICWENSSILPQTILGRCSKVSWIGRPLISGCHAVQSNVSSRPIQTHLKAPPRIYEYAKLGRMYAGSLRLFIIILESKHCVKILKAATKHS